MSEKVHFYFGDETFLVDEKVNEICDAFPESDKKIFQEKFELQDVLMAVSAQSLFASSQLILIKDPWFIGEKLADDDFKKLEQILKSVDLNGHQLIIYKLGAVDQRKKAVTYLKKNGQSQQFSAFKDWEQEKIFQWIRSRVALYEKTISQDAVLALEQVGGHNLRQLAAEIEKIVVYVGEAPQISEADIKAITAGKSASIFQFSDALRLKDTTKALDAAKCLMGNQEDPIRLMGMVISNIRTFCQILSLVEQGESSQGIAKATKKNPYFLQKIMPGIQKHYTLEGLKPIYRLLNTRDVEMKSGKIKAEIGLEMAILDICRS